MKSLRMWVAIDQALGAPKLEGQEEGEEPAKETKGRPVKEERIWKHAVCRKPNV